MLSDAKKKRLAEAMKRNIARRKGIDDIDLLKERISKFNKPVLSLKTRSKISYSLIFVYIVDLIAGGLAGFIIGIGISRLFNIKNNIVIILCFVFGIMGGFYNIVKNNSFVFNKK